MTLSGVEWVRAPSGAEGLALAAPKQTQTPERRGPDDVSISPLRGMQRNALLHGRKELLAGQPKLLGLGNRDLRKRHRVARAQLGQQRQINARHRGNLG